MLADDHAHEHEHVHGHAPAREKMDAAFSLLRISAAQRLGLAAIIVAALWIGVRWAMT